MVMLLPTAKAAMMIQMSFLRPIPLRADWSFFVRFKNTRIDILVKLGIQYFANIRKIIGNRQKFR